MIYVENVTYPARAGELLCKRMYASMSRRLGELSSFWDCCDAAPGMDMVSGGSSEETNDIRRMRVRGRKRRRTTTRYPVFRLAG